MLPIWYITQANLVSTHIGIFYTVNGNTCHANITIHSGVIWIIPVIQTRMIVTVINMDFYNKKLQGEFCKVFYIQSSI